MQYLVYTNNFIIYVLHETGIEVLLFKLFQANQCRNMRIILSCTFVKGWQNRAVDFLLHD